MFFCPLDGTLLQIAGDRFCCPTCPYASVIRRQEVISKGVKKKVDDILGGAAAWEHVDRTHAVCPQCSHGEAYFLQIQIRSADEPMSVFYKCVDCHHQWNDR